MSLAAWNSRKERASSAILKIQRKAIKASKHKEIYQLKIKLRDIRPPIWRGLQVPSDVTLGQLHRIIQEAMGWYDSHLHQFIVGKKYYGMSSTDNFLAFGIEDESKARVSQVLSKANKLMVYEYDFGDGWEHEILLESALQNDPAVRYPRCIAGARACPPEDCGGSGGYANFLAAIRDPDHEEHDEYLDWIGGEFDPEEFDLKQINTALRHTR